MPPQSNPSSLPAGYTLDAPSTSSPTGLPAGYTLDAPASPTMPVPSSNPSLMKVLTQPTDTTDKEYLGYTGVPGVAGATIHGLSNVAHGTLDAIKGAASMFNPTAQPGENEFTKLPAIRAARSLGSVAAQVPQIPGAIRDINASPDPLTSYANAAQDTAAQGAGQAIAGIGTEGLGKIVGAAKAHFSPPEANLIEGTYSKPGSQVAASLRSNARFDVPAAAADAHPAIAEGLADRGISAADFKGRNGPQALQSGIDNAIDIQEARAKSAIDPIRGEKVDPQVLAQNPELASRFPGKQNITYGDLDAERLKMNKELRRANFYSKDPSAQYAVADPLANTEAAVNQARDLVYGKAQDATGYDLRPLKQTESNLIKLGDLAETTKNTLSAKAAQHEVTPLPSKVWNSAKNLIAAKANPISSFFSYEKQGLRSPLSDFNRNMQGAFADVKPATASRTVAFPRYNLQLTPPAPGNVGPTPMQNLLNFSKEAHPELSPTRLPESSIRQKLLGSGAQPGVANSPRDLGAAAAVRLPSNLRAMISEMEDPAIADITAAQRGRAAEVAKKYPTVPFNTLRDPFAPPAEPQDYYGDTAKDVALREKLLKAAREAKGGVAPAPRLNSAGALEWPDVYQNPPQGGGGNYTASDLDTLKKRMGVETAPQGGHAGGGVASVEEINRPGKNYVVSKEGRLTYHGKSFAPEETPKGAAHVTVLPGGKLRVNAGDMTPAMEQSLRNGLRR